MDSLLEGGEDWLLPLSELREELKKTQEKEEKKKVREFKRRNGKVMFCFPDKEGDDTSAGPYTLDFCKQFLRKLFKAQVEVRVNGPDPKMVLINEDEIHEIQRIWRMERGDWKNSAYEMYEEICKEKLEMLEDLGGFGKVEQEILTDVCQENKVPQVLVSKLLHAEFSSQGMGKHSKVFKSLNKILSEEWRNDLTEIVGDMKKERSEKKKYR